MNDSETWNRVVEKLIAMTHAKELVWTQVSGPLGDTFTVLNGAYIATVDGKFIRIYEYEYQHWIDEDESVPSKEVTIEFVDNVANSLWKFPDTISRWSLLNAIRYQLSDAEGFLRSFLKAS